MYKVLFILGFIIGVYMAAPKKTQAFDFKSYMKDNPLDMSESAEMYLFKRHMLLSGEDKMPDKKLPGYKYWIEDLKKYNLKVDRNGRVTEC